MKLAAHIAEGVELAVMEDTAVNDDAVREIRAEMARQRITQRQLAARLGRQQPYVQRRLSGHVPLTLDDLAAFAEALGLPAAHLWPSSLATAGKGEQ
jgi:transcriptional regulator with XRE-family HTH domain